jgi:hypothetical protein
MCCFSKSVDGVDRTRIFARGGKDGRQFLAYEMQYKATEDLSMILPLPVPPKSKDDAIRFISLKDYPDLFDDLAHACRKPGPIVAAIPLEVKTVGDFEASFVPSVKDFGRLDERFRLPEGTWDALPLYKDFGFAVFKLKKGKGKPEHPMAFEFPRGDPKKLFFPTLHIHDGQAHPKAKFSHVLYCQKNEDDVFALMDWAESPKHAGANVFTEKAGGLVDPKRHVYVLGLWGERDNVDIVL